MSRSGHDPDDAPGASNATLPARPAGPRRQTLFMTADGHIAYPAFVPPSLHAPRDSFTPRTLLVNDDQSLLDANPSSPPASSSKPGGELRRWRTMDSVSDMATPQPLQHAAYDAPAPSSSPFPPSPSITPRSSSPSRASFVDGAAASNAQAAKHRQGRGRRRRRKTNPREGRFQVRGQVYRTFGHVKKDGRLSISVRDTFGTGHIAKAVGAAAHKMMPNSKARRLDPLPVAASRTRPQAQPTPHGASLSGPDLRPLPRLNIVVMVIGSRGDAQPFLKIAKLLKEEYGHRVRIATHPAFRDFVERDCGLEFFSVGGDPSELMSFMVKNPGMIPSLETVKAGDIGRRRESMADMFQGFWRACIAATDDNDDRLNLAMVGDKEAFVADVIIANPPSFAHIHCAEALGVPLHLIFTFPYTPTQAFPHPLASIKKSSMDPAYTNFISYPLVDMMVWQGLGDLVNNFRVNTLALDPVSTLWAPDATYRLRVPFTYLWSPSLVQKPDDWGDFIDIAGFVFLDLASSFSPPPALEDFLREGDMPIYIGFGSIVIDDPAAFSHMIFQAVAKAGVRAVVSKGWGGLGGDEVVPENIFMLDNTPHDWLFPRVKACVIHGGAGTTAIALKCGLPTMIVPFFGDQHFWGAMVACSGAGPSPVPYKELDADKLCQGIQTCLSDETQKAAATLASAIEREGGGAKNAVASFHSHLKLSGPGSMRCSLLPDQIAAWRPKRSQVKLSPLAADILVGHGKLSWNKLKLIRHMEWNDFEGPGEPITGIVGSLARTLAGVFAGIGGAPFRLAKTARRRLRKRRRVRQNRRRRDADDDARAQSEGTMTRPKQLADERADGRTSPTPGVDAYAVDIVVSAGRVVRAIVKAPADLLLALAQGLHNAPRLYGDTTVRRPTRITGFRSGLVASRRELVYGLYDAVTGLVAHPIRGARNGGVVDCAKGVGLGLGGFVLKTLSAVIGPLGYTLRGLDKQVACRHSPHKAIRRARIAQGQRQSTGLSVREHDRVVREVLSGWQLMERLRDELATTGARRRGRLTVELERLFVDTEALFESPEVAARSLDQLRAGKGLEETVGDGSEKAKSGRRRLAFMKWFTRPLRGSVESRRRRRQERQRRSKKEQS